MNAEKHEFLKGSLLFFTLLTENAAADMTPSGLLLVNKKKVKLYCRPKKTADFLRDAVETRLRMYIPYIESWPQVT